MWSEKLDGVRAMWDGKSKLFSRNGLNLFAPLDFTCNFPKNIVLDGELWIDRNMFADTVSIIRSRSNWSMIKYMVFDCYSSTMKKMGYMDRFEKLSNRGGESLTLHSPQLLYPNTASSVLAHVLARGGEGIILRDPHALYSPGRSAGMVKLKPFFDEEGVVIDNKNLMPGRRGSILVSDSEGRQFKLASGLKNIETEDPPKVGDIITYQFSSRFEDSGLPRFPRYIRLRSDHSI